MIDDPIVAEVRRAREEYARKFNYDLRAICEDIMRRQKNSAGRPVVDRSDHSAEPSRGRFKNRTDE